MPKETDLDNIGPIQLIEDIVLHLGMQWERTGEDQLHVVLCGSWHEYSTSIAWSSGDHILRLISSFQCTLEPEKLPELHALINHLNMICWTGAFYYIEDTSLVVWKSALPLHGTGEATPEQIEHLLETAKTMCDVYYPTFHTLAYKDFFWQEALSVAISPAVGRA